MGSQTGVAEMRLAPEGAPESQKGIAGEVAVVLGAGGGVGRAVVRELHDRGARLAAGDLRLSGLAEDIESAEFDAGDPAAVDAFARHVEERYGPATILVNCQGVWHMAACTDVTDADWLRVLDANLTSVFNASRAFLPGMRRAGRGVIVSIASTAGEYGSIRPAAHYAASKGGLIAFCKSLAREVAGDGIRVNVVSPGPLDTAMLGAPTDEAKAAIAERCPLGRLGTPEDVAAGVRFLVSADASWITGHVLRINGGSLI